MTDLKKSTGFTTAAVFSDHMVLQRNKWISIFGEAADGAVIQAQLFDNKDKLLSENSTSSENGRWLLQLEPQEAKTGCRLTITCGSESKRFSDIAIGEVWLAGGQSNMEFELQNCKEGPAELSENDAGKKIRFYYTNKIGWIDEKFYEAERQTCWQTWESPNRGAWSAVAYFFAKKLAADLDCVIGLIGCNWGGTSASAWMRREYLEEDRDLNTYLSDYAEATRGKSIEEQCQEFDAYEIENAKWQEKFSKLWEKQPGITWAEAEKVLGKNPWPGPESCKNPYRPCGLYDCMVARILPYTLKGVLWYQGESDDHKPTFYFKLFRSLIDNWRNDWKDQSLPFIFVQLPVHRYEADPDFKHWPIVREAQAKVGASVRNAWLTSAFDLGQYSDIHPVAKKELAERMEKNALANVYQLIPSLDASAPQIEGCYPLYKAEASDIGGKDVKDSKAGQLILSFSNAALGFTVRDDKVRLAEYQKMEEMQGKAVSPDFTGFELAGSDGIWYPAKFALGGIDGKLNTIILCSEKVSRPIAARYGWYNYGPVTIYGKNGLPLCPFRITALGKASGQADKADDTGHAKIQQIMTV